MFVATGNIPGSSIHYWSLVTRICYFSARWINKIFFISNSIQRIISFFFQCTKTFSILVLSQQKHPPPKTFLWKTIPDWLIFVLLGKYLTLYFIRLLLSCLIKLGISLKFPHVFDQFLRIIFTHAIFVVTILSNVFLQNMFATCLSSAFAIFCQFFACSPCLW